MEQKATLWKGSTPVTDFFFFLKKKNMTVFDVIWLHGVSSWRLADQLNEKHLEGHNCLCWKHKKNHYNHYKCAHYFHCNWLDKSSNGCVLNILQMVIFKEPVSRWSVLLNWFMLPLELMHSVSVCVCVCIVLNLKTRSYLNIFKTF